MGEFFVARHYRREGVGRAAALRAIGERPGPVGDRGGAAQHAGPAVLAPGRRRACASGAVDERDQQDERWNGLLLRFAVA